MFSSPLSSSNSNVAMLSALRLTFWEDAPEPILVGYLSITRWLPLGHSWWSDPFASPERKLHAHGNQFRVSESEGSPLLRHWYYARHPHPSSLRSAHTSSCGPKQLVVSPIFPFISSANVSLNIPNYTSTSSISVKVLLTVCRSLFPDVAPWFCPCRRRTYLKVC